MTHVTDETLSRYLDEELGASEKAAVRAALDADAQARARLARMERLRRLVRMAATERAQEAEAELDGLWGRIQTGIATGTAPRPGLVEQARAWWGEFIEHRRMIWMPAGAALALSAAVAVVALRGREPVVVHPAPHGSEVVAVSFGEGGGAVYEVPTGDDSTTVVIWMNE